MKIEFIHHTDNNRCLILIFAGWSTDADLFRNITRKGWDVAVVYDYSNFEADFSFLDNYATVYLFAWSLGVKAAAITLSADKITAAFAINGTLTPVDDLFGIPTAIYNGTADNLDARNLKKFRRRMAADADTFRQLFDKEWTKEEIIGLRNQLYLIRDCQNPISRLPWKRAYISEDDRIFPPDNIKKSWEENMVSVHEMPGSHYVPMEDIVNSIIPDLEKIADRFSKASDTYNEYAKAQLQIAERLANLAASYIEVKEPEILEIGPGTGILTHQYIQSLQPSAIDFVDIADIQVLSTGVAETYFKGDAELWMHENEKVYDCILSASTVQWFMNIPAFLKNCHRSLRPGGVLAFSTFLPGNLAELDNLRPSPIIYHDIETLHEWLKPYFADISITAEDITLEFASHRELLMHLKRTGVGGSVSSGAIPQSALQGIHTLTYRPVYVICRKPDMSCNTL